MIHAVSNDFMLFLSEYDFNDFESHTQQVNSPCSVGILVDRGFGKSAAVAEDSGAEGIERHISMLFIGGADDREALCYARRMAGHPNVTLTVVRFVESKN